MEIRSFERGDESEIAALVHRNLFEVNIRDYPLEEMKRLAALYSPEKIREIASCAHMYVAIDEDRIVGTGSIGSYQGRDTESILLTIFILPEWQGRGAGRAVMEALEQDVYFLRANRVVLSASITAAPFYEKMGYGYHDGRRQADSSGVCFMEKWPVAPAAV
jgi:GNAT superfamily N-acetyltransferase